MVGQDPATARELGEHDARLEALSRALDQLRVALEEHARCTRVANAKTQEELTTMNQRLSQLMTERKTVLAVAAIFVGTISSFLTKALERWTNN